MSKKTAAPSTYRPAIPLYHHRTDGGAQYLTDKFIACKGGHKEGIFEGANFIVRIDGDITKDAELRIKGDVYHAAPDLLEALDSTLHALLQWMEIAEKRDRRKSDYDAVKEARAAIAKAKGAA